MTFDTKYAIIENRLTTKEMVMLVFAYIALCVTVGAMTCVFVPSVALSVQDEMPEVWARSPAYRAKFGAFVGIAVGLVATMPAEWWV